MGDVRIIMAVIGPIVQTPSKNYLPYQYYGYHNGHERVDGWTHPEGPVRKVEIVTDTRETIKWLWFGWR